MRAERAAEAAAVGMELLSGYARRFIGRMLEVLTEGDGAGYTPQFLEAAWEGGSPPGRTVRVAMRFEKGGKLEGCLA